MNELAARRKTRTVYVGRVAVGCGHPVSVQSMCNTKTADVAATLAQIEALAQAGADIGRLAVPDQAAAAALPGIVRLSPLPLIADIHFDHCLALAAVAAGMAGLRLNPGNIGGKDKVREVAQAAAAAGIPIRVGVNAGSVRPEQWAEFPDRSEAMVQLALRQAELLEDAGCAAIKISLKSSSIPEMLASCRRIAGLCDYPLHLGVTEAGTLLRGSVKSAVGIGALLAEGIGDTMRVSLTDDPLREVEVACQILAELGLREQGWQFVSCPTCGRTEIDLIDLAGRVEEALSACPPPRPMKVAIMGCVVNGPGEAADAELGVAGGRGGGLIFVRGKKVGFYPEEQLLPRLLELARRLMDEPAEQDSH
ncbi:MAG: flavodoxin-dependent (E)-4-hydroxy-3-methylbut-2-enyl-diphosphate synthase [Clostridia bacterium]|nr:flavodoxin-dependent (E)-4-hydroxy-3-methylbut-2-enyl-diphosphate synthase [Clostridia bacterium]